MRIRKVMVAIISVLLILMSTISYSALEVHAEKKLEENQTEESSGNTEKESTDKEESSEKTEKESSGKEESSEKTEKESSGKEKSSEKSEKESSEKEKNSEKSDKNSDGKTDAESSETKESAETAVDKSAKPAVSSSSYVVMSGSTSEIVVEHHAERKMQPGKICQLMTAMVVIDNMYNEEELTNTVDINNKLAAYGSTFAEGESVSVGDLLTAMLVGGDEQAAEALASYSASKRKVFINEMNAKSMALGIMDTQFENPSGAYKETQYATAKDCAVITQAAMRYPEISAALQTTKAVIAASSKSGERKIAIKATDPLLAGQNAYEYIQGGMAGTLGYPVNAAQFAAVAVKDDMQLITILMDSAPAQIGDEAKALFEYADTKVTRNTIVKKGKMVGHARIRGGVITRAPAYTETKGFAYVPPEGSDSLIQTEVVMSNDLEAPLSAGDKVGEYRIYVADELKGTVNLVLKSDIAEGWPPSKWYISNRMAIIFASLIALVALFILRVRYVKKRRERRREAMRRQKIREIARKQLEIDEDRKRREWSGHGYDPMPPRTTDIRKTAISDAVKDREQGR